MPLLLRHKRRRNLKCTRSLEILKKKGGIEVHPDVPTSYEKIV
ncbi:MAG: hypothetical protein ABI416_11690 [Ginsengibacter sp.]